MNAKMTRGRDGGILLVVMFVVLVVAVLGGGLMKLAQHDALETVDVQAQARAFWLAEAGIKEVEAIVTVWKNRTPLANLNMVGTAVVEGEIADMGSYSVDIADYTGEGWNNAGRGIKRYVVRSTGTTPGGVSKTVEIHARTATFANYIYATHEERDIRFTTGDVIKGDVHSNDEFTINGKPIFEGDVTSSANSVDYTDRRSSTFVDPDVFTQSLRLGAPQLDFGQFGINPIEQLKNGADLELTGDHDIEFIGGSYIYRPHTTDDSGTWNTNAIHANDIVYVTGNAYVQGRVGGTISVVSEKTIHITADIVYASSPNNNYSEWPSDYEPAANELFGLISKEAVQVDSQGRGKDINIHAAIYITKAGGSGAPENPGFGMEDRYKIIDDPMINLLGSIAQYTRGIVGDLERIPGEGEYGFLKNYGYDERFRDTPPPGIPYSVYLFSNWRQL